MKVDNKTSVTEFILLGFPCSQTIRMLSFIILLVIYLLTLATNSIIITIVRVVPKLHSPMYFFLSNFSFLEICYTTTIAPKMLSGFLTEKNIISYRHCILQLFLFFTFAAHELFFLVTMAYDRYVAICYPLQYSTVMSSRLCKQLAVGSWASGFLIGGVVTLPITQLSFCRLNLINHFFCDILPILQLSCSDTMASEAAFFTLSWTLILASFIINTMSYCYILLTILRIRSTTGRQKAFFTCSSHLTVVMIFYGTSIYMYMRLSAKHSFDVDKIVSLFYAVVTPLLNPLIYSLRNRDIIKALKNVMNKIC